jgi:hypothetical protein
MECFPCCNTSGGAACHDVNDQMSHAAVISVMQASINHVAQRRVLVCVKSRSASMVTITSYQFIGCQSCGKMLQSFNP